MSNIFHIGRIDPPNFENLPKNTNNKIDASTDPSNITKYTTATSNFGSNNENAAESFINRPATAFLRVIDKFSALSGLGVNGGTLSKNSLSVANGNKDKKTNTVMAYQLQAKVEKLVKIENKLMILQSEISNDLINWAADIPNLDCEVMVKEFSSLLATQHESNISIIEKLEKLKLSFKFVNQREKKLKDLINTKSKIVKALRDNEVKYGPNASSTTLLNEKLEETIWNLDVLEQQYIRAISKELKDALVEFAAALQSISASLSDATADYYNCLFNLEANADYNRSSPKKYGNQVGIGLKGKDICLSSSNIFNGLNKTANEIENSRPFNKSEYYKKDIEYSSNNNPIKMVNNQRSFDEKINNHSLCSECLKMNRFNRLITPCTHTNTQNSDNDSLKHVHPSSTKLNHEDSNLHDFRIRDPSFQQTEQWG